ncbi:MAG: hypothetical protein Kow0031_33230 [Anaerolineae bacterium]
MLYQITITKAGCIQNIAYVEAPSALAAINRVEAAYEQKHLYLSSKGGQCQMVAWSGYEFEARRLPDTQHMLSLEMPVELSQLVSVA